MTHQPLVAIVFLNYNGKQLLERNLPFVLQTTYENKIIVVIDNGSVDDSVSFLKENHPSIFIIRLQQNKGYAGGYNEGLKQINADYFILLNTDVEVSFDFIEPLIGIMIKNPGTGICQPKILSLENRNYFEYAGAAGGFMDRFGFTFARGRMLNLSEEDTGQYDDDCDIFWASGTCLAIKASLFHKLQGFYDYYFMYSEEVDLCWRCQLLGYKIRYCHASVVYHRETKDLASQSSQRIYYVFRNNFVMLLRNLTFKDKLIIIPARVFLNIAASFHFLLKGYFIKSFIVIRSMFDSLKWLIFIKRKSIQNKKSLRFLKTVYNKSILADYYFRKTRRFSELNQQKS
jgi:GT2 family glycosyltransferase